MSIRFFQRLTWRLAENVVKLGFLLFTSTKVWGKENVPRDGRPLLVVCNHLQMADIPLLVVALPRKLTFLGKRELWRVPVLNWLASWYQAFSVNRNTTDTRALRRSLQVLREGGALVVFPEGKRSLKAELLKGQDGAALIALHSSATILPVAVSGTERADGLAWVWRRPRLTVRVGRPFRLERRDGVPLRSQLAPATDAIMRSIASLLPRGYRGEYDEHSREETI